MTVTYGSVGIQAFANGGNHQSGDSSFTVTLADVGSANEQYVCLSMATSTDGGNINVAIKDNAGGTETIEYRVYNSGTTNTVHSVSGNSTSVPVHYYNAGALNSGSYNGEWMNTHIYVYNRLNYSLNSSTSVYERPHIYGKSFYYTTSGNFHIANFAAVCIHPANINTGIGSLVFTPQSGNFEWYNYKAYSLFN